jgi:hypothetical protein
MPATFGHNRPLTEHQVPAGAMSYVPLGSHVQSAHEPSYPSRFSLHEMIPCVEPLLKFRVSSSLDREHAFKHENGIR